MSLDDFAKALDGKQYGYPQFTEKEIAAAKENGFVIVTGTSDDLMEFEGAICDEGDCFDGRDVYFDRDGVSQNDEKKANCITAAWCDETKVDKNGKVIPWTYQTDILHASFMVYEDNEPYCRGIVFSINDVK